MPPTSRRGSGATSGVSEDSPFEEDDPKRSSTPSFAYQALMETQGLVRVLSNKIDTLIKDRETDRAEYRSDIKDMRADFKEAANEIKAEHKEFRKDDFKPLKDEVTNLKLKWAWVSGIAAAVGAIASIVVGIIQKKLGLG